MKDIVSATDEDRYLLKKELGRGGMGSVWLAEDTIFGGYVAIKTINRQSVVDDEYLLGALKREARLQARLSKAEKPHPNIVSIIDFARLRDEVIGLVMEYVDGETLMQKLGPRNTRKRFELPQFFDVALQTCSGLHFAHEMGILHRDIKPSNVMIHASGVVKIVDWGVSKNVEAAGSSTFTGTPPYMAPEVVRLQRGTRAEKERGVGVDRRADVYSLGVTLFQLLSGGLPFDGEDQILSGVTESQHRVLSKHVDGSLADIVLKAMALRLDERYQSAEALRMALRNWQTTNLFADDLRRAKADESRNVPAGEAAFQGLLRQHPANPEAYYEAALFNIRRFREEAAIEILTKGIETDSSYGLFYEVRGRLYAKRNSPLAAQDLQKALALVPQGEAEDKRRRMLQLMLTRVKGGR